MDESIAMLQIKHENELTDLQTTIERLTKVRERCGILILMSLHVSFFIFLCNFHSQILAVSRGVEIKQPEGRCHQIESTDWRSDAGMTQILLYNMKGPSNLFEQKGSVW